MATITDCFLLVVETTTDSSTNPPTVTVVDKMIPVALASVCADVPTLWTSSAQNIAALIDRTGPPAGKQEEVLVCAIASNDTLAEYVTQPPVDGGTTPDPDPDPLPTDGTAWTAGNPNDTDDSGTPVTYSDANILTDPTN